MKNLEQLIEKWNNHYPENGFWKDGKFILSAEEKSFFEHLHRLIIPHLAGKSIECFTVCGWSERHQYFRSKHSQWATVKEAKTAFNELKKDDEWRIPTLIVKEIFYGSKTVFTTLQGFLQNDINHMGFSDQQELIEKHMMGNKAYRWKDLGLNHERLTY